VLGAIGLALWRVRRRERRRAAAATPEDQVLVAWEEVQEALALAGLPRGRSETSTEFAERIETMVGVAPQDLAELAEATQQAAFSATGVSPGVAGRARAAAERVRVALLGLAKRSNGLLWALGIPSTPEKATQGRLARRGPTRRV